VSQARAGALAVGAGVTGLGLFFLLGARAIPGEAAYAGVGPRVFPILIGAALLVLGAAFLVSVARAPDAPRETPGRRGTLVWILGGVVLATAAVRPLGFPAAAALLFTLGARGFGDRRWLRSLLLGAALGVGIYVAFSRALGVSLPGGPLAVF
jgi:putative tricarboxylic transport membrane protein